MSKPKWHNMRPEQAELYKIAKRKGCSEDASMYLAVTLAGVTSGTIVPSGVGYSSLMQRELLDAELIEIRKVAVLPWHYADRVYWFTPDHLRERGVI